MPNPRAQKPLTLEQITLDAKRLGVPVTAMMDMLAGGLKGSTTQTVGGLADIANAINEFSFRGQLPKVPFGSEELSRMTPDVVPSNDALRKHSAEYGQTMGGFIPTPMSGQALQGAVKLGAKGAKALGEEAGRRAVMGESFTPFVNTAIPRTNVVKPEKGGNWLAGNVEKTLESLKQSDLLNNVKYFHGPEFEKAREARIKQLKESGSEGALRVAKILEENIEPDKAKGALNQWVDKNLTNYVKKEMGTPEDPVRKLAEQGIVHIPSERVAINRYRGPEHRQAYGGEQLGKSEEAKAWEDASDVAINVPRARGIKENESLYQANPWVEKLADEDRVYALNNPASYRSEFSGLGFDHILDVLKQDIDNGRLRPESLKNVSMEQAVRRAYEYDQEMAKKMAEAQIKNTEGMPVHKEYPEGYKWIELAMPKELPEGWRKSGIVGEYYDETGKFRRHPGEKKLEDALKYEGETMGHCVGGYCPDVLEGRSRIFSLRDAKGEPHVTVELEPQKHPIGYSTQGKETFPEDFEYSYKKLPQEQHQAVYSRAKQIFDDLKYVKPSSFMDSFQEAANEILGEAKPNIVQIKGKQNLAPKEQYLPYVQDFVRSGNYSDVGDLKNTGLITTDEFHPDTLNKLGIKLPKYLTPQEKAELNRHIYNYQPDNPSTHTLPESIQPFRIAPEPPVQEYKDGGAVQKFDDGGSVTKDEDLFKPFFGNPHIQKQGAIARQNALERTPDKVYDPKTYGAIEAGLGVLGGMVNPIVGGALGIAKSIPEAIRTKQPPAPLASKYAEEYLQNNPLGQPETEKGREYLESFGKLLSEDLKLPPVFGDLMFAHNVGEVSKPVNMMLKDYFKANPPSVGLGTKDVSGLPPEKFLKPKTAKDLELEKLHDDLKNKIKEDGPAINAFEDIAYDDKLPVESQKHIPKSVEDIANIENMFNLAKGQVWNKGRDLKEAMQKALKEHTKELGIDTSLESPETHDYLVRMGVRDAMTALEQNPNAVGWYDQKTRQALDIMSLLHPEIATDPNARTAFVWPMAVTSNGLKVNKNFELANQAYELYKKTGVMPNDIGIGTAGGAINEGLDLYNTLKKQWGPDNLRKFMDTDFTVGEISAIDKDLKPTGEHSDVTVKGSSILGPKIGNGFYSNLNGNFDSLTMDRWLVRTWGRWTGTLLEDMPKQTSDARNRANTVLQDVLKSPEETRKFADLIKSEISGMHPDDFSRAVQEASMLPANRDIMNNTPLGEEARKAGNSLAKYLDAQKEAPAGPTERKFIRKVFGDVLHELRKDPRYKDLSMADLQASLWYAEKRLYETAKEDIHTGDVAGYEDESAPDYANAARDLVLSKGISQRKIDNLLKRGEEDARTRATRLEGLEGTETDRGEQGASRGLTESEKRTFKEEHATKHIRSNKQGNDATQWTYTRKGDEPSRGPRVLKSLGVTYEGEWQLGPKGANAFRRNEIPTPNFYELDSQGGPKNGPSNAERFAQSIQEAKDSNPHGASVYVYSPEEYANMRLFLTKDGKAGVAVKPDGDIVSVFKHKDAPKGTARALLELAVEAGGRKLDAFDTVLPHLYSAHGFKAISRTPWAEQYAPEGWNKETYKEFNRGEPDVVYMVYDPSHFGFHEPSHGKVFKGANNQSRAVNLQNRTVDLTSTQRKPIPSIPATSAVDRINMAHKDVTKRVPELTEGAKQLFEGKLSHDDYTKLVDQYKPITPYEFVPALATPEEMASALNKNQLPKLMASRNLPEGYPVAVRLDIPAYTRHNVWIPTIHEPKAGFMAGAPIGYDSFSSLTNAELGVVPKSAQLYATGRTDKNTFATIKGNWKKMTPEEAQAQAEKYLKDKKWTQVGMDPERHSYFYDRKTGNPVTHADEILQVGPLVLAKNAKNLSKKSDFAYKTGGAVQSLETNLPALPKTDYHSIDKLMSHISKEHKIHPKKLHDDFVAKHHLTPDTWIKRK